MTSPLPVPRVTPHASRTLVGAWRAVVEREAAPYAVSIPELFGAGRVIPDVEVMWDVLNVAPLTRGQRVWVVCVDGDSSQFVVIGRRI